MYKHRDASQRLMIEFFQIEADLYQMITRAVVEQFQLVPVGELVSGLEERFQGFSNTKERWSAWNGISGRDIL